MSAESTASLIPRPLGISTTSLCAIMGLENDTETYKKFLKYLRETAAESGLDTSVPYREQDPQQLQRFFEKATNGCPLLSKYEDYWPIKLYMRKYFGSTSWHHRHRGRVPMVTKSRNPPKVSFDSPSSRAAPWGDVPPKAVTDKESWPGNDEGKSMQPSASASLEPFGSDWSPSSNLAIVPHIGRNDSAILQFLNSFTPSLEYLAPRFAKAGVNNEVTLISLAKMSEGTRYLIFVNDMKLTSFEYRQLCDGLSKL